jgi:hypothetical protein
MAELLREKTESNRPFMPILEESKFKEPNKLGRNDAKSVF